MTGWIPADPATVGDVEAVHQLAAALPLLIQRASDSYESILQVTNETARHWRGTDAEAWHPHPMLAAERALALDAAGSALRSKLSLYLEELERIGGLYAGYVLAIEAAVGAAQGAGIEIVPHPASNPLAPGSGIVVSPSGGAYGPILVMPGPSVPGVRVTCRPEPASLPLPPDVTRSAEIAATRYEGTINAHLRWIDHLYESRHEADESLALTLRTRTPGTWGDQRAMFEAHGLTTADQMTSAAYGRILGDEAAAWIADGSLSAAEAQRLSKFSVGFGADAEAMGTFVDALGGNGIVVLTTLVGDAGYRGTVDPRNAVFLGQATRAALSSASATWSREKAEAYATTMIDGANDIPGGTSAVGYLFGDPARSPVGETLTVAVADRIDAIDRGSRTLTGWPNGWITTTPATGGLILAQLEAEASKSPDANPDRVRDPMGRVLETLGRYPQAATAWLTDPATDEYRPNGSLPENHPLKHDDLGTTGAQRLLYYFGERDWSVADGFEGPAALWRAVSPDLDPDPARGPGSEAWDRSIYLTGAIANILPSNPWYQAANLSADGAREMGRAVGEQLLIFGEFPVSQLAPPQFEYTPLVTGPLLGQDDVSLPNATAEGFEGVVGPLANTAQGQDVLSTWLSDYRELTLQAAAARPEYAEDAARHALKMELAIKGAAAGSLLAEAADHDAAVAGALAIPGSIAGAIPAPGGYLGALGWGTVVTGIQGIAGDRLGGHYDREAATSGFGSSDSWEFADDFVTDYFADLAAADIPVDPGWRTTLLNEGKNQYEASKGRTS